MDNSDKSEPGSSNPITQDEQKPNNSILNDIYQLIQICNKKLEQEPFHTKALLLRSSSYMKSKEYKLVLYFL